MSGPNAMSRCQMSIDDGVTWVEIATPLRVAIREVSETEDEGEDLYLMISDEGIVLDRIGQVSGLYHGTAALDRDALLTLTGKESTS